MKRRWKILITISVLLVVTVLIGVIRHHQLRAAVEAYKAELKALGEPMELSQVLPPAAAPDQNGTEIFRKAVALLAADEGLLATNCPSGMKMVAPGKAMIRYRQPEIREYGGWTNSWKEVIAAVAQNKETFETLRQFTDRPELDFQFHYELGFANGVLNDFHLVDSKRAAQRLSAAALCDLHVGDTASAVKNIHAALALTKAMQSERLVISELVRQAMASIALNANWELLQASEATDQQLAQLQNDWLSLDFVQGAENALAMERVTGALNLAKQRSSNSELQRMVDNGKQIREAMGDTENKETFWHVPLQVQFFMWRHWWTYSDELRWLKGYETLLNSVRVAKTNGYFQNALKQQEAGLYGLGIYKLDDEFSSVFSGKINFHSITSEEIVTFGVMIKRVMRGETAKQLVVTAIALKRYQLKHGESPADLSALAPEFVPATPLDPVDGRALRYHRNDDGTFVLYSIGENGVDDGGNPFIPEHTSSGSFPWQNPKALDWVWPKPASAEEIQKYYAGQAGKSE